MAKNPEQSRTEISGGARVNGKVRGSEDLIVRGRIDGTLVLEADLIVEREGIVKADVTAHRVRVSGILVGDVTASEAIEISPHGRVSGDLSAPTIRIEDGARFAGGLTVGEEGGRRRSSTIAPPVDEWRSETPENETEIEEEVRPAMVTTFAVPATPSDDERRKKRVVIKKRR